MTFRSASGSYDQFAEIILEEQTKRKDKVPWAFRVNNIMAGWLGMQIGMKSLMRKVNKDRLRSPPPEYEGQPLAADHVAEDRSLCRTVCQGIIWIIGTAIAIIWWK